ncbi:Calx-beta domain-containing protein [Dokdonia sp. Hel_I_63]|uniref:Calx-beta domain-containing protein n=1 Tax=Dokdonia sp. Hel_I_63 TaxID=1249996 RepID=UPI0016460E02|nr:Calx-beta domain-containing protein [Dokdonia sp. Hel_I_63]
MKRTLLYTLVFFSFCTTLLSQNPVTGANIVGTLAQGLQYNQANPAGVTNTYSWGQNGDFRVTSVALGGDNYFLNNDFTQISYNIVRVDGNGGVTGDRCGFFVLEIGNDDFNYQSSFPGNLGDCSMEEVLRDPIVTRGANDVFKNGTATSQNIERIDALYEPFVISQAASLQRVGFLAPEKNGNSSYRAAPVLSVDAVTGEPTSFGAVIEIGGADAIDGTNDFGAVLGPLNWSFLVNSPTGTGNPYRVGGNTESVAISLITLADLGYNVGDTVYGISFFDNNVPFNADLLDVSDPNDFPNTDGGGADIHGGLGAIVTSQAIVNGHVYNDLNVNGFQDVSEPNLPNVTITVTDSANIVQVITTDANGDFSAFVAGGDTTINVDENDTDIPSGSVLIEGFGNDGRTYNTVPGQNTFTSNFGFGPDPGPPSSRSCDDDPVFITSANFDANTVVVETEGGTPGVFDVGDVFRFSDVTAGLDCLVSIDAFVNGAGILVLDGEEENIPGFGGFSRAFQPQMDGTPGVNGQEVVFTISYVQADTTIPQAVSVYFTALDLDSNTLTDVERVKFETPDVYYTNGANSTLIVDSSPSQLIGMSTDAGIVGGINTDPNYAFTAYYNSFTSIQYTISKDGYNATPGFEDRQFSLLFEDIAYPTEEVNVITNPIICGQVFVDGAPAEGVTVNVSGDSTQTVTTDANGQYSFTVPGNGSYTITESDPPSTVSLSDADGANDNIITVVITRFESSQENDFFDGADTDGDGVINTLDIDDDNDGILDTVESGGIDPSADADGDGIPNYQDADFCTLANGVCANLDPDGDSVPNHLDLDADGDGIPDNNEAQSTLGYVPPTTNANGIPNVTTNGLPVAYNPTGDELGLIPVNTDAASANPGLPDYLDTDSDNDGILDSAEHVEDFTLSGNDSDGDGLDDAVDTTNATVGGEPNYADANGIINNTANLNDNDSDLNNGGNVDFRDRVNDIDFDNDGVDDNLDEDDDNDGILDVVEGFKFNEEPGVGTCTGNSFNFVGTNASTYINNPATPIGTQGAQYRFSNVITLGAQTLDGIVTITNKPAGVTVLRIDDPNGVDGAALQPVFQYASNVRGNLAVTLTIRFVESGTLIPFSVDRIGGFIQDIDSNGNVATNTPSTVREFYRVNNIIGYALENPSRVLAQQFDNGVVQFTSDGSRSAPIEPVDVNPEYRVFFQKQETDQFTFTIGAIKNTNAQVDRFYSLRMDECEFADFANPVIVFIDAPNTDGTDGPDYQDTDADDDGCSDTIEAGFVDAFAKADEDGQLGNSSPVTVDPTNGRVISDASNGGAGYTMPKDTNGDGIFDFQDANESSACSLVSIGDVIITEGNTGTITADFQVTLTEPSSTPTVITYSIQDDTATTADNDYTAPATLSITIPANTLTGTISIPIVGDTTVEGDETFTVTLESTSNGMLDTDDTDGIDNVGTATITNDDDTVVSINNVTVIEGDAGTVNAEFTVSLTNPVDTVTTVTFTVTDDSAENVGNSLEGGNDYEVPTTLTVTIPAGETEGTVTIIVNGDETVEADEDFLVTLTATDNGTITTTVGENIGTGTITNDDATVVSIGDVTVTEGADGTTVVAEFPVTLSAAADTDTVVTFTVADGTGTIGDADYVAPTVLTVTIPAGETTAVFPVTVNGDDVVESDEDFEVTITNTTNGTIDPLATTATGTITNDDATVVSIGDVTVTEGADGTTVVAEFPVTLSAAADTDTVVTFTVADGTGTIGDADYVAPTVLTVTIPAGETTAVFPVTVNGDDVVESDEDFEVTITNTTNGTIDPLATTATGTITNDDATVVSIGDVTVTEGADGTTVVAEFPVTLSAAADTDTVVTFTVADGTGTIGDADYVAPTVLTVTIPAGETTAVFPVTVNGDDVVESDEDFEVTITNTTNGTIDPLATTATGTITNDDATVVSIGDVTVTEGADGTTVVAEFPVTLSAAADTDTVVTFTVADGTGTIGDADYVAPTVLTVTIPAGETTAVFPVTVNGDDVVESDEDFEVTITNTTNGTIDPLATTATGTITNDDATVVSIGDVTVTEGADGTTVVAEFPVTLSAAADTDTVVTFTVADGTGTIGDADYVAPTVLTVTIPAGETTAVFPVTVNGDDVVESDEDFEVTITNTTNGTIDPLATTATGTITNDDATVVSIGDVTVTEGADGTTVVAEFPVTLSAAADTDTVVTFTVADGTGTIGDADYVAPTVLTVTIPAGETTAVFPVTVNGDDVVESDEDFEVTITNTTNGTIDPLATTATGTITNDDATVVSIGDVTVTEGADGTTVVAEFPVTLSAAADTDTVVTFTVADGTGTIGDADYVAPTVLTVTIPAGETTAVFPVTVNGDDVVESDEDFEVTITNTTNGTIDPLATTATGTITNDDATVVSIGDVTVTEGADGTTVVAEFPVTLSAAADTDTVVTFTVADGTGTIGDADYVAPTVLTVTIPAGETTAVFPVTVNGDDVVESDEDFEVTITNTTNGTIDPLATTATGTITNDDATVVSIGDVTVTEGADGTTVVAEFPVTLSAAADTDTVVTFTVADGTGTIGDADYVAPTVLTVTIPAGETTAVFPVTVNGDDVVESDEDFEVTITNTTNGTIDPLATTATGTITNDDATVVSIGDVTVTEGADGTTVVAEFPVTLSAAADTDTVVTFTVADGTGTIGDADYVAPTVLTVTIPAGETTAVFPVTVNGDDVVESDEDFEVTITNTTNGTIDPLATTATGTITNDDATVVSIGDVTVTEGADGTTVVAEFPVTLSAAADTDTVVTFTVADGTGTIGDADYVAPTVLTVTIPAGETTAVFPVTVNGDDVVESDEDFEVTITNTTNGTIDPLATTATGTITNDDATVVSIGDVTVTEGADGTTVVAEFPVTLSAAADTDTVVTFTVADGTGTIGDADYVAPTVLTVTIPAGETTAVFPVTVNGDDVVESDEDFEVTITNTTNGTIDPLATTATGTITNDDATVVSIGDVTVTEGADGTTVVAEFPVTLSAAADTDTVVTFTVADGTGTIGDADYVAPTVLTVTIPAGETTAVFPVTVNGDDVVESDEDFEVTITNTTNGTIDPLATTATGTITNDDATVVSIGDVTVTEGADGTTVVAEFPVTLSAAADTDTVVTFTVADGTGTIGDADYVAPTVLTVTIPAGETTAVFPVTVNGDDVVESDEDFEVTITNTTNGTIDPLATTATGTITNDDATVVSIGDVTVTEGADGTTVVAEFPVTLSAAADTDTVVTFTVADGTGTIGDADYVAPTVLTVTIPAGETTAVFPVTVNGDDVVESDEDFEVTITNTTNGTIDPLATTATGTITNDDATVVSIGDVTVTEGADGTTVVAEFPVTLSAAADTDTVVTFTVADGTGTIGDADYVAPTVLTVTIPAGETTAVFPVTVNGDDVVESDEDFEVTITNTTNGTIDPLATTATGTITNDDATVVSIGDVTVTEGADGTTVVAEFPVTLSAAADTDTVVTFTVADGTGTIGDADYVAPTVLTVTIPAGETTAVFPVTVNGDDVVESDEDFEVTITNTTNGTIDPLATTATGTITNDDATVVSIGDVTVTEGADGTTVVAEFPVTLSAAADTDTVVTFTVADGTGTIGDADYVAPTVLTVTIPAGETTAVFPVTVNGDDVVESDEDFEVTITNTTNGTIDPLATTATGTITNDDATVVSIGDVTVTEGADGTTVIAEFPVTLSAAADTDTVVTFTVADGTGTIGDADYVAPTVLTVTIPAGETTAVFPVTVNGDDVVESDEDFEVTITNTTNGTIDPLATTATGTITNDDATVVSIGDVTVTEGADGTTVVAEFPVTLSAAADTDTVVTFTVADGTGTIGDADYVAPTVLTVTIPAGETTAVFPVTVNGDDVVESDEDFEVTITNTTNGTIDPLATTATGTITNDDATVVSIGDVTVTEGADGTTVVAEFPVTLSAAADTDTVVTFTVADGTGTIGDADYVAPTVLTVTIPAGETTAVFPVTVNGDDVVESDEDFEVTITNTTNGTIDPLATTATGTITNDDATVVSIGDVTVTEGADGTTVVAEFPVTLSAAADTDTVVTFTVADGTGTIGDADYVAPTVLTVTIPAGETTAVFPVTVNGDDVVESDEDFEVTITNTTNGTIDPLATTATGTITNDDATTVTIEDVIVDEGAGTVTIPVTLSNPSDEDTVIEIVTTTGTAGEDDYTETIVTVTIPAGETTGEVVIPITDDMLDEDDETFTVDGTVTSGNTDNTDPSGTVTITDNDGAPTVTIEDVIVDEGAGTVTIPVTLSNPSDEDTVIEIVTTTGTAGEDDYTETIVTVTIPAGETTGEVVIPITDDMLDEDDETFTVDGTVTSGNTDNTDPSGTVTITDNDGAPTVTIEDVIVDEGAGTVTIPVTLSNPSNEDTVIEIVTTTGTAGEDDYTETIVTVTIPAGETTGEVVIPITDDMLDEDDETFTVDGTVTSGNTDNTDPSGTVTITDNDGAPTVTIEDVIVDEGAGTVTIPVTLSNPSDEDTVIEIVTTTGTANEDDYTETIVTVTIPAGETTGEVVIPITDDMLDEDDETFTVDGTVTSGNTDNTDPSGTVTITDNDGAPTVTIEDVIVDEGAGTVTIPVTLSNPSDEDTVIEIVTTTGTAGEDDYTETIVTVTIPAGETTGEVVIPITDDMLDEDDETFTVDGTVTSGNTDNTDLSGTVTITDNDGAPTVTIEDVIVDEGAGTVTIPVTLSNPSDEDTVIEIVTTTGTAGEDDYTETIVTVTIPAGETTGEVVITITDDMLDEDDETFTVDGTVTSGNTDNTDPSGTVTITDNDGAPTVTIEDVIVDEGAGTVTIPVTLSNPSDEDTVIEIVTTTGTAGEDDYTETIVTVTIPAGETTGEVVITITDDMLDEDDETFTVDGTVTSGNTDNTDPSGTVTITDNDGAPTVTIEDVIVDEGAGTVTIPVTLSNPSDEDTVIEIVTTTGTAGEDDYIETIVTVTIPAGETTGEVVIPITDDMLDEEDETFTVEGTVTSGNTDNTDPSGTVTITDNDAPVTNPNLDLVKVGVVNDLNGNDVIDAGDTITYTLTITNNGNEELTNVIVVDPLIIINEGPVAVLAISESATFTGTYIITQNDIEAGGIVNVAIAEGTDQAGNTITDQSDDPTDTTNVDVDGDGDFEDPTVTILDQSPDIMITKNGVYQDFNQDGFANAGDQILYTFNVINTGNVILNDVVVTDEMVDVIGDPVSLLPGESVTFTAVYIITQQDVDNGEVVNTALAIGLTDSGLEISDVSDDVTDTTSDDDPTVTVLSQNSGLIFNNGISMNGDGRNDSFRIQGIENFPENRLRIFNRWGVEVYEAEGYGSDGKAFIGLSEGRTTITQDKFLPVGTYYWILEYVNSVGETINNSGYLYLTR